MRNACIVLNMQYWDETCHEPTDNEVCSICGPLLCLNEERLLIEAMFVFLCRVQVPPAPVFTRQPFVHSSWQRPEARSGRSSRQPRRGRGLSRNKYSFSARITSHLRPRAGCWMLAPRTLASCEDLAVCPQKVSTKCLCNFHNMRVPSCC